MPAAFDNCVKKGGRVRTVTGPNKRYGLKAGEYVHVCILAGNFYRGEVKKKESGK